MGERADMVAARPFTADEAAAVQADLDHALAIIVGAKNADRAESFCLRHHDLRARRDVLDRAPGGPDAPASAELALAVTRRAIDLVEETMLIEDTKNAHAERALANADLGRLGEARRDAEAVADESDWHPLLPAFASPDGRG